jgi:hypothetical protein
VNIKCLEQLIGVREIPLRLKTEGQEPKRYVLHMGRKPNKFFKLLYYSKQKGENGGHMYTVAKPQGFFVDGYDIGLWRISSNKAACNIASSYIP